jgi:hypothetical protein
MPNLTQREMRTIRLAGAFIAIYLLCFFGLKLWKGLENRREQYQQMVWDAQRLRRDLQPYENRLLLAQKLKETFRIDPAKLSRATLVADASAAIQREARNGGVQLGPIRETTGRSAGKELAAMQIEANGPVAAVMGLLPKLEKLGYPLVVESVQINSEPAKQGVLKINLTISILDYEAWKAEEVPHA